MDTKKIIQALTYLAYKQEGHVIDNMKAFKLLWLADRYRIRNSGRTITGDTYYAMPYGLVPSDAKCLLDGEKTKLKNDKNYKQRYIKSTLDHSYEAVAEPDLDQLSEADIEALDRVLALFGNMEPKELSEFSHLFPEWIYYKTMLLDGNTKKSYKVNADHFFEPCDADKSGLFAQSKELLALTKEYYHQNNRI